MRVAEKSGQRGHSAAHVGQAPMDGRHGALQARQAREERREEVVEGAWWAGGAVQQAQGLLVKAQLGLLHLLLAAPLGPPVLEPHLQREEIGREEENSNRSHGSGPKSKYADGDF